MDAFSITLRLLSLFTHHTVRWWSGIDPLSVESLFSSRSASWRLDLTKSDPVLVWETFYVATPPTYPLLGFVRVYGLWFLSLSLGFYFLTWTEMDAARSFVNVNVNV
jgi:hypothetical protein